ncbi:MAG: hypothetical protein J5534_03970 [Fibrobacter sp.]|nr:hypothetical protein [Fibrobacter sp.]
MTFLDEELVLRTDDELDEVFHPEQEVSAAIPMALQRKMRKFMGALSGLDVKKNIYNKLPG